MDRRSFFKSLLRSVAIAAAMTYCPRVLAPPKIQEMPNANGRIYVRAMLEKARREIGGAMLGYVGRPHPDPDAQLARYAEIANDIFADWTRDLRTRDRRCTHEQT